MGRFLNYHAQRKCTSPLASCLFRRDDAFFKLLCHTGDRGSDLGLVQIHQIQWMREGKGIVLEVTAGKTTRGKKGKRSVVLRSDDPELCPILTLQRYLTVVENTYEKLTQGYLFRVAHKQGSGLTNQPALASVMTPRLQKHLRAINEWEGETTHSARSGCAIALRMLGVSSGFTLSLALYVPYDLTHVLCSTPSVLYTLFNMSLASFLWFNKYCCFTCIWR